jgi:hypothetical protein
MSDDGKLTFWTAFLILAGIGLVITGAALAPDHSAATWLLVAAWAVTMTALNNVYGKVREKIREREIREQERHRAGGQGQP